MGRAHVMLTIKGEEGPHKDSCKWLCGTSRVCSGPACSP